MTRLHPTTLPRAVPAAAVPRYAREGLRVGIVHLGLGAFARAHLGVVNEAALAATQDLCWGCAGVSLRHAETRDALGPQAGLYTVATRDAADDGTPRESLQVVGNLLGVHVAAENPQAVLDLVAHADTRIASLTVTEKGYCHDPASGRLRLDDPQIAHDLAHPDAPTSAIGFLVRGLQRRRQRLGGPLTVLSLDNLPANGRTLRGLVLEFAAQTDPALHDWTAATCRFPNSMVDRIVPRTTDADRARIAATLGLTDAWPVCAEPFLEWAVEDDFAAGRPRWELGGAQFVADAGPYERRKLRMLNGAHSALAYLGRGAGFASIDAAIGAPALRQFTERLLRDEVEPTLHGFSADELVAYRGRLLRRFANPALRHATAQIAMDGSQKLPQRLLAPLRERLQQGAPIDCLALAVAAWLHDLRGHDDAGNAYAINDPLAGELHRLRLQADAHAATVTDPAAAEAARVEVLLGFAPVFGTLGQSSAAVQTVARHTRLLRERGVLAALGAVQG